MWPFKKSLSTESGSGMTVCDGKHHVWSAWGLYSVDGTAYSLIFRSGVPFSELRQHRHCVICNFTEDIRVDK
jgi:hypothetical protein